MPVYDRFVINCSASLRHTHIDRHNYKKSTFIVRNSACLKLYYRRYYIEKKEVFQYTIFAATYLHFQKVFTLTVTSEKFELFF